MNPFIAGISLAVFVFYCIAESFRYDKPVQFDHTNAKAAEVEEEVEDFNPSKVIVTYNDGSTDSFCVDKEITALDSGALIIRLNNKCVTISPYAYRKVEEL